MNHQNQAHTHIIKIPHTKNVNNKRNDVKRHVEMNFINMSAKPFIVENLFANN